MIDAYGILWGMDIKTNYHTHTTWCDGCSTPEAMIQSAIERGFTALGFSSHARLPECVPGNLTPESAVRYAAEIRALAATYAPRLRILLGVEADYIAGVTAPTRTCYGHLDLDYLIGSVHYVPAPDGALVCVDDTPDALRDGIRDHFDGDALSFLRGYFAANRDMAARCDCTIIGHPDLVRKFNVKLHYFDEDDLVYRDELAHTAEVFAASGKIVEVNTGGIARGWMDDAYPSSAFRDLLRARGCRFILSSDAHFPDGLDCAFDRFAHAENYVSTPLDSATRAMYP